MSAPAATDRGTAATRRPVRLEGSSPRADRVTVLPENLVLPLQEQLSRRRAQHQSDVAEGFGSVWLPDTLTTNTRRRPRRGGGNGSSRRGRTPQIRAQARSSAITCTNNRCNALRMARPDVQGSTSLVRRMCCAIRLRRIYFRPDTTFALSRSCWATRTSARR